MKKDLTATTLLVFLFIWLINPSFVQADTYSLPLFTVTNVLVVPKDQQLDPQYPQLISNAVHQVQEKYTQLLGGQTFKINESDNPLVIRSNKTLSQLCNQKDPCDPFTLLAQLPDTGLPISDIGETIEIQTPVILNIYVVGWTHPAMVGYGWWYRQYDSSWTLMGDSALASLKGRFNRNQEMLCQQILGRSCSDEDAVRLTAHELGHAFGLSTASRWANSHPCTTAKVDECRFDLDPKYRPDPIEWTHSLMGFGSIPYNNLGLNDSCVNPEKTLLKNSRYFGGTGYDNLNFDNCLKLPNTDNIKVAGIENGNKVTVDDEITIQTERLLPTDSNLKVVFPGDNTSQSVEILGEGKLLVTVPKTFSGEIILVANRGLGEIRSNPYPITIISRSPMIQKIEPAEAKPGDTMTIWGDYFMDDRPNIQSSKPLVRLGGYNTAISDILEYTKNYVKFQVPLNVTAGEIPVTVEVGSVNTKTQKFLSQQSNQVNVKILGSSRLEGRLERATTASTTFRDVSPGELVNFTAFVLENSSTPQTAEIWVMNQSGKTGCDGKSQGKWCQAGQLSLPASSTPGRYHTFTGSYIPKSSGAYVAVINILESSGVKCSGDPNRGSDWVDCGENSRLYFTVLPKQEIPESDKITAHYQVNNNSGVLVGVMPTLCDYIQNGSKSCVWGATYSVRNGEAVTFDHNFYAGTVGKLQPRIVYEVGCTVTPPELNQPCVWQSAKLGDKLTFKVLLEKVIIQPIQQASPSASIQSTCSLTANSTTIKAGESINWTITSTPKGTRAYWRGTNNGVSIVPTEVERYSAKTPWEESYQYLEPGFYTRYVGIEDETGKTICSTDLTTGPVSVSVQEANKKITNVTLSSAGQVQDMLNAGPIRIHLPGEEGYAQTFNVLVTVQYSDSSRSYQNLSFRYTPPQTANPPNRTVCTGECGDANGKTTSGLICSGWIEGNKWSNCPDPQYPYCFTCPEIGQTIPIASPPSISLPPSPSPPSSPTSSVSTDCKGVVYSCTGLTCSDGTTPPGTGCYETNNDPNNRWMTECLASCPTTPSGITSCTGEGEVCADSAGKPMDGSNKKCTIYVDSKVKDKSCADKEWYCWKDCY